MTERMWPQPSRWSTLMLAQTWTKSGGLPLLISIIVTLFPASRHAALDSHLICIAKILTLHEWAKTRGVAPSSILHGHSDMRERIFLSLIRTKSSSGLCRACLDLSQLCTSKVHLENCTLL